MTMAYDKNNNTYSYHLSDDDLNNLVTAMREQGRVDIGYGDISNRQSLLDTYTGGLNMLTGLTSDSLNAMSMRMQRMRSKLPWKQLLWHF